MPPVHLHAPLSSTCDSPPLAFNRLSPVLVHIPWYSIAGPARLAAAVGVSRSTICRIMGGKRTPSPALAEAIAEALSVRHEVYIPMDEIFSPTGRYPTPSTCLLTGCGGCLPDAAWDRTGDLKPEWQGACPGDWCAYPAEPTSIRSH